MKIPLIIRGRQWLEDDIAKIQNFVRHNQNISRAEISRQLCALFQWHQTNGRQKDRAMRDVLLKLNCLNLISLPFPRSTPFKKLKIKDYSHQSDLSLLIKSALSDLRPLRFIVPDKPPDIRLFNEFLDRYHYLQAGQLIGSSIRYFVQANDGRLLALISFGSPAWKLAPRDEWIGWNHMQREKHLHLVVNNIRFLILPWIKCSCLASHILGRITRILPEHWLMKYNIRPVLLESFVDITHFKGTSYKAANWQLVGRTKGRGKRNSRIQRYASSPKDIYLYPLHQKWRNMLSKS
jgi:hypothetical protein